MEGRAGMTSPIEWHGWSRVNRYDGVYHHTEQAHPTLHIGHIPGRTQAALYMVEDATLIPLAWFKTEEDAQRTMTLIDYLLGLEEAQL